MKRNIQKTDTMYRHVLKDIGTLEYGWYEGGKAFIALNGEVLKKAEAFKMMKITNNGKYGKFIMGVHSYDYTINGLVRALIDKYNKD